MTKPVYAEMLDSIVAVVNDDVIMESELAAQMARIKKEMRERNPGGQVPPNPVLKKEILEQLILLRIQLQQAERLGINIDDSMLNRTINQIARQNGVSLETFRETLQSEGFNFGQFRETVRDEITTTHLRQRQIENRIFVSEKEIDNYLATKSQQGLDENEYRLQHILIAIPEGSDEQAVEKIKQNAEGVLEKLRSGSDFSDMVREFSDAGNKANNGDLGWMTASKLPSLFSSAVRMNKGEISDLLENSSGLHIIKLTDKRSDDLHIIKQTKARHILLKPNALLTEDETRVRLNQLKDRIEAGDDFSELARSHSEDRGSAVEGGDLGWLSPGNTVPEFEETMDTLQINEVSKPFKSRFGWHIVQVTGRRDHDGTEELTRAKARAEIKKRKSSDEYQTWLSRLRDEAYVEYR